MSARLKNEYCFLPGDPLRNSIRAACEAHMKRHLSGLSNGEESRYRGKVIDCPTGQFTAPANVLGDLLEASASVSNRDLHSTERHLRHQRDSLRKRRACSGLRGQVHNVGYRAVTLLQVHDCHSKTCFARALLQTSSITERTALRQPALPVW